MALWHNWPHRVNSNKQAAEVNALYVTGISMNTSGDPSLHHWSLVSKADAHFVHCDLSDTNPVMSCCWQKNVPMQHWRWGKEEWGVDISPKITFLCGESCFLVVHWVPDLPKLTWQDPPTGAWDNAPRLRQPMAPSPNVPVRVTGVLK